MTYRVNEVFHSVQGEGFHAGRPSMFLRFSGCNLWNGRDEDRIRDSARNSASCPRWCDTDFAAGRSLDVDDLIAEMLSLAAIDCRRPDQVEHIVITGGEPTLQMDVRLLANLHAEFPRATLAIETNGTRAIDPDCLAFLDWVTVSPKTYASELKQRSGDELKVIWPGSFNAPHEYREELGEFDHYFVSPLAMPVLGTVGKSILDRENIATAFDYARRSPGWKLSLQTHKVIGAR